MTSRLITALSTVVAIVAVCIYSGTPVSGQARATPPPLVITAFGGKAVDYKAPRTPWGDPDLQGVWSSDDMENVGMAAGGGRGGFGRGGAPQAAAPAGPSPLYLDDAALAARKTQIDNAAKQRDTNADSSFRFDYARRVFPQTRLIVDPPDGRLPAIKVNQQERQMPRGTYGPGPLNSWEDFSLYERCITRGIAGSILRVIYGNGNRIVQAPGVVAFSTEMLPDTRIFYTDGRKHIGQSIREYLGDSTAHWEGEELVVETTNLTDKTAIGVNGNGVRHSTQMVITERFRRVADKIIQYQATYDDPVTYEKPFTVSFPLTPLDGGVLLPYDCHPGNTAISMALSAERAEDRAVAADAAKGINRPRRSVQDDGAGVGAAPPGGGRGAGRGRGAGPGQPPPGTATGERDVER
ncbi:MAG TPA: hypothetical protein VGF24_14490 [Vicinamibacterales bacterium]|jgi:hypothetical protein